MSWEEYSLPQKLLPGLDLRRIMRSEPVALPCQNDFPRGTPPRIGVSEEDVRRGRELPRKNLDEERPGEEGSARKDLHSLGFRGCNQLQ